MKTNQLAPFVMFCPVAVLVGCASIERPMAANALGGKNSSSNVASSVPADSPADLHERTFQKLDLNTNGTLTLGESQYFDATTGAEDNFNALHENGDGLIHSAEFLGQAPKYSKSYRFFGDTNSINQFDPLRESEAFHPSEAFHLEGLQLFSIHF